MQKILVALPISMLIALGSISQTSSDTVCLPSSQLKLAIEKIERGKQVERELILTNNKVVILEKRIALKDSLISKYNDNEKYYNKLISNYETSLLNNTSQIQNLEESLRLSKKIGRRQKLSKWIIGILGLGLGYLIGK